MKFVLYTNSVSAHQLPLAREIAKLVGEQHFRYVYTGVLQGGGQEVEVNDPWISCDKSLCEDCDILLVGGLRPIDLLERRSRKGLKTYYQSERWFKPIPVAGILFPGWLRLLVPRYRKLAFRFVRLMNHDKNFITLPIGPWARRDFRILGVRDEKMIDWGYFVEESKCVINRVLDKTSVNVLYVGRLLRLKRIDTIIKAVAHLNMKQLSRIYTLTIVGSGPEKQHLERLSKKLQSKIVNHGRSVFEFRPSVPIAEVRAVMQSHDVVVFASNAMDGWGAVVNEALSEGVPVVGTYETGASAAILPESQLFHSGDWRSLAAKLCLGNYDVRFLPRSYTALVAAQRLVGVN